MIINYDELERLIGQAARHYEKTAPTVEAHMEDLALRLAEMPEKVSLYEVSQISQLLDAGEWEHPNHAANRIYKLRDACGMDTTGHIGF